MGDSKNDRRRVKGAENQSGSRLRQLTLTPKIFKYNTDGTKSYYYDLPNLPTDDPIDINESIRLT